VITAIPTCRSPDNPPRYAPVTSAEHLLGKVRKQKAMGQAASAGGA
jgi:hypothetical protein